MSPLTVIIIALAACWIGFVVGVLFVCVVETGRAHHRAPCQPPREREVSL